MFLLKFHEFLIVVFDGSPITFQLDSKILVENKYFFGLVLPLFSLWIEVCLILR